MSILTAILYVMIFVVALLLIGLILIQPSKSGGMGAAFGGIGESVFGGKVGSHLTKTTVIMTTVFFVIALALAAFIGHGLSERHSNVRALAMQQAAQKPAAAPEKAAVPVKPVAPAKPAVAPKKPAVPAKPVAPAKK